MSTSDIISLIALAVSVLSAIANYLYTKRQFEATALPYLDIEVTSEPPREAFARGKTNNLIKSASSICVYLSNSSNVVPVVDVQLTIIIQSHEREMQFSNQINHLDPNKKVKVAWISSADIVDIALDTIKLANTTKEQFRREAFNEFTNIVPMLAKMSGKPLPAEDMLMLNLGILPEEGEDLEMHKNLPERFEYIQVASPKPLRVEIFAKYKPGIVGGRTLTLRKKFEIQPQVRNKLGIDDFKGSDQGVNKLEAALFTLSDELQGWAVRET